MKEPPETKLTPELELLVQKTVESRLKELPASTYQLLEKMVHDKVAAVEKFYRWVAIIAGLAVAAVAWAYFDATARNALKKVSDAIASSAIGERLKDVQKDYDQIQTIKNQVTLVGPEAMDSATKITTKLKELETQDNIVRYSYNGNLILNLQDGELRFRRKNPDAEIILTLDKERHFKMWDGTNEFLPLENTYNTLRPGTPNTVPSLTK
jgi:hypothetical protein